MYYYNLISKSDFVNLITKIGLKETKNINIPKEDYIKYYKLGINTLYYKYGYIILHNDITERINNEKGTIYYQYHDNLINFFKKYNICLKINENIDCLFSNNHKICKIPSCKYLINYNHDLCHKHIIFNSLKKYLYLKLINDISIEIPDYIFF
jgi:hypothetical protein